MTAIASLDLEALAALTYIDEHPCLDDRHAPTAYWCLPGTEPGTPIRLVHAEFCAGSGVFPGSEVFAIYRPLLDSRPRLWGLQELPADYPSSKRPGVPKSRYMLFVVSGGDPPSGFTIRLTADGLIQGIGYGCGDRPEKIWDAWLGTAQPLLAPPAAPRPR